MPVQSGRCEVTEIKFARYTGRDRQRAIRLCFAPATCPAERRRTERDPLAKRLSTTAITLDEYSCILCTAAESSVARKDANVWPAVRLYPRMDAKLIDTQCETWTTGKAHESLSDG